MPLYQVLGADGALARIDLASAVAAPEGATVIARVVGADASGNGGFLTDDATADAFEKLIASVSPKAGG